MPIVTLNIPNKSISSLGIFQSHYSEFFFGFVGFEVVIVFKDTERPTIFVTWLFFNLIFEVPQNIGQKLLAKFRTLLLAGQ